jgi:glycosyltransferase involved in cell wall biosynthesis
MFSNSILKIPFIKKFIFSILEIQEAIDTLHCRIDVSDELFDTFQKERQSDEYQDLFSQTEPLVSVCVATYNRSDLLIERCVRSILNQDYQNLEIIVIGDCCTDNTEAAMEMISDKRLRFYNLPQRGHYPSNPDLRWMVAGTKPINEALKLATGDFITHLDDDDEYLSDRISKLVTFIQESHVDFIWHPFWRELPNGRWQYHPADRFRQNEVTTSTSFYHKWFKCIPWDINAYKFREPGDWNRFRKFKYLNAHAARFTEPLLRHYKEKMQSIT